MLKDANLVNRMTLTSRKVQASQALRALQIFESLSRYRPTFVGSTPIDLDLNESDLDIICEVYDLDEFEQHARFVYSNRSNFNSMRVVKYSLPSVHVSFFSHNFRVGIFGQGRAIEEQAAYIHMKIEERLLQIGGESAREGIRDLKRRGFKTEPAFAVYFDLPGDPYQALLDLAPYSDAELQNLFGKQ
jgi:hypothetical protein